MKIRVKIEIINNGRGSSFRAIVPYGFGALTNLNDAKKVGFDINDDRIIIIPMEELDDTDMYEYVRKVSYNCQPRFVIPKPLAIEFLNLDKKSKNLIVFHLGRDFEFINKFEFDNLIKIGSNSDADIVCASSYHRDGHTLNIDEKLRFSKGAFEPLSPKICDIIAEFIGRRVEFDMSILKAFA